METTLKNAFLGMKRQEGIAFVEKALDTGADPFEILRICRDCMEAVGRRFETGEFFLSELIYSAQVFKEISAILEPRLIANQVTTESSGKVVFGTPKGDIHDLGKDIVITLMRAQGLSVYDLGVDVPPERFIEKLQETGASVLALSALITPAFDSMRETIALLGQNGLREKTFVIIGGGVITELVRQEVGADAWTMDPPAGVRLCMEHLSRQVSAPPLA
jgi:methanogenic corrinoid protein MtbC1